MKRSLPMLLFFSLLCKSIIAQDLHTAPSLQVGLSGIDFSRGNFDAELVAEIISEKQQELKVKLIKNMLLDKIGVSNGLFYAYISNTIDIISTEKDEEVRVKNLLENSVNLAFVVSYAEYYMRTIPDSSTRWHNMRNLLIAYGVDTMAFSNPPFSLADLAKIDFTRDSEGKKPYSQSPQKQIKNALIGVIIDLVSEAVRKDPQLKELGLMRTNYLQNSLIMNAYIELQNGTYNDKTATALTHYKNLLYEVNNEERQLLNTIHAALKNNRPAPLDSNQVKKVKNYLEELKKTEKSLLGNLISNEGIDTLTINYNANNRTVRYSQSRNNKYWLNTYGLNDSLLKRDPATKDQYSLLNWYLQYKMHYEHYKKVILKRDFADAVFSDVQNNIKLHLKYFGLIKAISSRGNSFAEVSTILDSAFKCSGSALPYDTIMANYRKALADVQKLGKLSQEELKTLSQLNGFMEKVKYINANSQQYLSSYETDIKAGFDRLANHSAYFLDVKDQIQGKMYCVANGAQSDLKELNINISMPFIHLLENLDKFDKAPTFDKYLNQLSDAGDLFSNEEMRNSINRIISFVRGYIKFDEAANEEKSIMLDVEGFIASLQRMPFNRFRPLQFHFTLGMNNAAFNSTLILEDGTPIKNFSYMGEKIGVKYKIWDWAYTRSFSRGETFKYYGISYVSLHPPKQPTVSNLHLLAYGSGLLYNLVNTGTEKDFNNPLLGVGIGLTFFNDLDLNISWGKPIMKNQEFFSGNVPTFFNVGFDIQFLEYYERLRKKREAKKTQNLIQEAKTNKAS